MKLIIKNQPTELNISDDDLAKLKKVLGDLINVPRIGRFIPAKNERYYWIDRNGNVDSYSNVHDSMDNHSINSGNCYRTQEEALQARDKQYALVKYNDLVDKLNGDWVPDWADGDQAKWGPYYDNEDKNIYWLDYYSDEHQLFIRPLKDKDLATPEMYELVKVIFGVSHE